jgi:hypothetical protein
LATGRPSISGTAKGLVHSEVLEDIEKLVDKGFNNTVHENNRDELYCHSFRPNTKHILLTRGIEIRNRYLILVDVQKQELV